MPMSVNMLGLRTTTEVQARRKNGPAPQSTTGVASTIWAQDPPRAGSARPSISDMVMAKSGKVRIAQTHRRRFMSTSSGFASGPAATVCGSSAMPHIGQAAGPSLRTPGHMGQTCTPLEGGAADFLW